MENKYKEILLLKGLDLITQEELDRFKFFVPDEFSIPRGKLETASRTEVATLMIHNAGVVPAVMKTICILQKLNYMNVAKCLQDEKEKVDKEYKSTKKPKTTQTGIGPVTSAEVRNEVLAQCAAPDVSPLIKPVQKQMVAQQESIREGELQKGRLTVLVLKATEPFEFETQEGNREMMFHATVATETEFFFVKVFKTQLKDKFTPKRIIVMSKYYWHSGFLEVNSASLVSDAKSNQTICVPRNICRKAGETPKIKKLQSQPIGTIVNGLFVVQKKTEKDNSVLFNINDNTGSMKVSVLGKQKDTNFEEGDKLQLTFFELSRSRGKLQLKSGIHSHIKVIKTKKK
ncbi:interferon-inducible protein AIM2 [Otolemur garnettii]|uniref:Interferon-inducible protein AIM2 n=1 Tax=Otolemur garnettii TaxID=30611 RepID=H0WG24_OTOGA|nr:interferon-inducible protein AIM2 [Otolemur garnettii]